MNLRALINRLADQEARLREATFLAPWVHGGSLRVRIEGLIYTFRAASGTEAGWGHFQPQDATTAARIASASPREIEAYLSRCTAQPMHLVFRVRKQTWLAMPQQGAAPPVIVHLVERGNRFDPIMARFDGASWWYEAPDRRSDPRLADRLRQALQHQTLPENLQIPHLTPALRTAYRHVHTQARTARLPREARRLDQALAKAGGTLVAHEDRGDHWLVTWRTPDGERHLSAIAKADLTVLSAGFCLDDRDADFDLASLVGVTTKRPDWMRY